jgi:branched-chain amino acid transport system permease protein
MMIRNWKTWRAPAFIVFLLVLPFLPWANIHRDDLVVVGFFALLAIGLTLVMGYAGQLVLSQAAFYGIGAYTSGVLSVNLKWPPLVGIIAGVLLAGVIAYLAGKLLFRLQGTSLALASLGMGIIIMTIIGQWDEVTRGQQSLTNIPKLDIAGFVFRDDLHYYYLVWGLVLVVMWLSLNIIRSRIGRALRTLNSSEIAAGTLGINYNTYKVQIFVLSSLFAGLAGGIYAHYRSVLTPTTFSWAISVEVVVMVAVGGVASIWGAPFGAALVLLLTQVMRGIFASLGLQAGGIENIIFGLALIVIMIYMPGGLLTGATNWYSRLWDKFATPRPNQDEPVLPKTPVTTPTGKE